MTLYYSQSFGDTGQYRMQIYSMTAEEYNSYVPPLALISNVFQQSEIAYFDQLDFEYMANNIGSNIGYDEWVNFDGTSFTSGNYVAGFRILLKGSSISSVEFCQRFGSAMKTHFDDDGVLCNGTFHLYHVGTSFIICPYYRVYN